MSKATPLIPAREARLLLMQAQGLLDDPARRATPRAVERTIEQMGFVQLDSIQAIARGHHLTMFARFDDLKPQTMRSLQSKQRVLFESWTHDASLIPTAFYPCWKHRFEQWKKKLRAHQWFNRRLGEQPRKVINETRRRLEQDGPLMTKHLQQNSSTSGDDQASESGGWWGWKPHKAALEYLWWTGEAAVADRVNFHKVYDLAERVYPDAHYAPRPPRRDFIEWMCENALARLIIATPTEIARFWGGLEIADARTWCDRAVRRGAAMRVQVERLDRGKPLDAISLPDWERRLARLPTPPNRIRLLSPFDPVIRDRKRLERLFDFDYRFEAFVPEAKRQYGYYVLPILEGDTFVGRIDGKLHRDRSELVIYDVWWERTVKPTKKQRSRLDAAIDRLARQIGAERWSHART